MLLFYLGGNFMKKSFFFCYNKNVSEFLSSKYIPFITVARDVKTGKIFSLYQIDERLQTALDEYKNR